MSTTSIHNIEEFRVKHGSLNPPARVSRGCLDFWGGVGRGREGAKEGLE